MYKNLYINGCSFTKGHLLDEDKTWPYLLGEKLNLSLNNKSANSNSMQTISDRTIMDLSNFLSPETIHSKDTLVIIGLTWPGRQSVWFDNTILNLNANGIKNRSNSDLKNYIMHRIGLDRSYSINNKISNYESYIRLLTKNMDLPNDEYFNTIEAYYNYTQEWIKNDDNWIRNNLIKYYLNLINLQSYFIANNINYLFVRFQPIADTFNTYEYPDLKVLMDKIDKSKIVAFRDEKNDQDRVNIRVITMKNSHPDANSCNIIAEDLKSKIEEIYYE